MDDKQLRNLVIEALEWAPEVEAAQIGVAAHDGVVTLSGIVPSLSEKVAAERATRRVKGVIPGPDDDHAWAQSRKPMDMIVQG